MVNAISFDATYDELFPAVYRYVYLRVPASEVEDVASEIMAKIWRHLGSFAGRSSLKSWALKLAANHVVDHYRWRRRFHQDVPLDDNPVLAPESLHWEDNMAEGLIIGRIFARLPERQMAVLQLRLIEGLSAVETAEILNLTSQAVDSLLYRAKRSFRQAYLFETTGGTENERG
jgi:RNA polymerase sigma-70 factor (ECF subfamily)